MPWPHSQDYNEAIQSPATSLGDPELQGGLPVTGALGMPMPRSGNFADVYEFVGASGNKWAIKCFTRAVPGLRERYSEISKHLVQAKLPFTVDFDFLARGIRIRGDWYPVLKMQWVEGLLLNEFVRNNLDKPVVLEGLGQIWPRMAKCLRDANVAHADLQHGNVLLVPGRSASHLALKLIDYDGMWIPALANKKSGEVGHPNYQHPQRSQQGTYNVDVDGLPLLVVACALRCLVVGGKSLWERYDNGDNLLFRESDLHSPHRSALFTELHELPDPRARMLVEELRKALAWKLEDLPAIDKLLPETNLASAPGRASPATTANSGGRPVPPPLPWYFDQASSPLSTPASVPVPDGPPTAEKAAAIDLGPLELPGIVPAGAPTAVKAAAIDLGPLELPGIVPAGAPTAVKAAEPPTTSQSPWDFSQGTPGRPAEPKTDLRVKRRGIPVWAMAASGTATGAAAGVVVLIASILWMVSTSPEKKERGGVHEQGVPPIVAPPIVPPVEILKPAGIPPIVPEKEGGLAIVKQPEPSDDNLDGFFSITVKGPIGKLPQGRTSKLTVSVERNGYPGPIELELKRDPTGVSVKKARLDRGHVEVELELKAAPMAELGEREFQVRGTTVEGRKQTVDSILYELEVVVGRP